MSKKKKIAILFDKKNDWLISYINKKTIKEFATRYDISFHKNPNLVKKFEIVFVLGFTRILGVDFLSRNKICMVIHESNLPKGRGFSPVQWQILANKNTFTNCLILMNRGIDSGEIVLKNKIVLDGSELYEEIRKKQAKKTIDLVKKFLKTYPKFKVKKQKGRATYFRKRSKEDSELNINKSIKKQFNLMRIANNEKWPLYFKYRNKTYFLKINKTKK